MTTGPHAAGFDRAADVVGAAYEEAMREHGILADAIKVISAHARANLAKLDTADAEDPRSDG